MTLIYLTREGIETHAGPVFWSNVEDALADRASWEYYAGHGHS